MMKDVNEHDEEEVRNILLHRLDIQVENVDLQGDHLPMLFEEARDKVRAQSLFVVV